MPDEWYRRSRTRSNSQASYEPSEDTVRRLADLQESEEEDEGEGTAKLKDSAKTPVAATSASPRFTAPSDWRNSIAQNRLSSLFDGWIHSGSPTNSIVEAPQEKKTVSEPKLISHNTGDSVAKLSVAETNGEDEDGPSAQDFEEMLVSV